MSTAGIVGRGIAWSAAGAMAGRVIGLANILLILTHLSVYEYGLIELTMSVVSTIGLFMLPGLTSVIIVDMGTEQASGSLGKAKGLFLQYFGLNLLLGITAWALLFFGSTIIAQLTGNLLIDVFFKAISFIFLISPFRVASSMLATVLLRYGDQSFFSVVEECVKGLFLIIAFYGYDLGAMGLLYANVLAPLFAVLIFLPRTLSAYRHFSNASFEVSRPVWQILSDHRKWSVGSSYVNTLSQNARIWIIKLMLGTEAVGIFAFAYGIFSQIVGLLPLSSVLTPLVPHYMADSVRLGRLIRASIKLQIVLAASIVVIGMIATMHFVHFLFPKYEAAIPLILVAMFAIIPNGIASTLNPVFAAFKAQRSIFFATILKLTLIVGILPVSLYLIGLVGAAVELLLTTTASMIERYFRVRRFVPEARIRLKEFVRMDSFERDIADLLVSKFRALIKR